LKDVNNKLKIKNSNSINCLQNEHLYLKRTEMDKKFVEISRIFQAHFLHLKIIGEMR